MCACDVGFECAKCAGTWLADDYPELPEPRSPWEAADTRNDEGPRE